MENLDNKQNEGGASPTGWEEVAALGQNGPAETNDVGSEIAESRDDTSGEQAEKKAFGEEKKAEAVDEYMGGFSKAVVTYLLADAEAAAPDFMEEDEYVGMAKERIKGFLSDTVVAGMEKRSITPHDKRESSAMEFLLKIGAAKEWADGDKDRITSDDHGYVLLRGYKTFGGEHQKPFYDTLDGLDHADFGGRIAGLRDGGSGDWNQTHRVLRKGIEEFIPRAEEAIRKRYSERYGGAQEVRESISKIESLLGSW